MGIFIPGKRATHRRFAYEPRFYDPEREEKLKRRIRIKSKVQRRGPAKSVFLLALVMLAAWIYLTL
ncbi:MAG: hypothetical protein HKN29_03805 [Rhodothermales bacterium]|nr:hypothetical protein [Rhodothermales bacterium]